MSEKCFTYHANEYEYEVCPFKSVLATLVQSISLLSKLSKPFKFFREVKQINQNSHSVVTGTNFKWLSKTPYDFSIVMTGGDGKNCPDSERSTIVIYNLEKTASSYISFSLFRCI